EGRPGRHLRPRDDGRGGCGAAELRAPARREPRTSDRDRRPAAEGDDALDRREGGGEADRVIQRYLRSAPRAPAALRDDFRRIRAEFDLPEAFPDEVMAAAEQAAAASWSREGRIDLRDRTFVTIDPPGSMDLD